MKKFLVIITAGLILCSCGNNKADEPVIEEDTSTANLYHWEAILNDTSGVLEEKKITGSGPDTLTVAAVLDFVNSSDSTIHLNLVKVSGDTVYIKIPDATHLTQQMGSTGSTIYLAGLVYNLTEVPGIAHVNLDFEEGDHASPGVFDRNSFKDQ